MDETEIQERIRRWYRDKARDEGDPFYRFLCLWICINAWLDYRSGKTSDAQMIRWLTNQTADASDLMQAYDVMALTPTGKQGLRNLASLSPIGDDRSSDVRRPDIVISGPDDKEKIIRGIYRIRCNLFHGKKRPDASRDHDLVNCANDILDEWLAVLIKGWDAQ